MNSFGRRFRVSIFGESHGELMGVVLDGVPAGIPLCEEDFAASISRRAPKGLAGTPRREEDKPLLLSGVFEGHTTGAPLTIAFGNKDTRPGDYMATIDVPRPGHSDYAASIKWGGANDPRGGGHFSGRLTLPLVAAGVVAEKMLEGISFKAEVIEAGGKRDKSEWEREVESAAADGDSLGAVVECIVKGIPAGVGEPFWDSVESLVSHAVFAIPGVRGIEFGDGFEASRLRGSRHNDPLGPDGPLTNGAGGVNGGISNGAPLLFRVAFKPASSISAVQKTYDFKERKMTELSVAGRHDVCFALRTPVIVEAVTAIVLADLLQIRSGQ